MALFQIRKGSTANKGTLAAGELYDNTELLTLQLGIDGTTEVTLMTSASIVNTISASLESTILSVSSSLSSSISTALTNLTNNSASFFTTINNLSSSVYSTDSTEINNITINSASAWGAFQSASNYSASAATKYALISGSNSFIGTQSINGSLTVTGDITAYYSSDERLKDNIQLISNPIEKVEQLRGVEFDWNDRVQMNAGEHSYGVIAQDVLAVLPELVKQRYDGYYGVDYEKIVALLIEVVKNQEKRIKELENK